MLSIGFRRPCQTGQGYDAALKRVCGRTPRPVGAAVATTRNVARGAVDPHVKVIAMRMAHTWRNHDSLHLFEQRRAGTESAPNSQQTMSDIPMDECVLHDDLGIGDQGLDEQPVADVIEEDPLSVQLTLASPVDVHKAARFYGQPRLVTEIEANVDIATIFVRPVSHDVPAAALGQLTDVEPRTWHESVDSLSRTLDETNQLMSAEEAPTRQVDGHSTQYVRVVQRHAVSQTTTPWVSDGATRASGWCACCGALAVNCSR